MDRFIWCKHQFETIKLFAFWLNALINAEFQQ